MRVLVVGGGGREHALVWKINQSPMVDRIFCAPGNAGIAQIAECVDIKPEEIHEIADFAEQMQIDLTVVGPEAPLTMGITDEFDKRGLKIFGPNKLAAEIEGSKIFAKNLMKKYNIPTAEYETFTDINEALDYLEKVRTPVVVKADGLAAGKGVIVAADKQTAVDGVKKIMGEKVFGKAGNRIVIEEYLEGHEVSVLAFSDGKTVLPMVSAQDHKRAFDNDKGPNTGGMGAFSPSSIYSEELASIVEKQILHKAVEAMGREGRAYKGVLYAGLMITSQGPKVLEFNCRFGDPETQVVLPRMENDLVEVMLAVSENRLNEIKLSWSDKKAVCVIMASGGYPGKYEKGKVIDGLNDAETIDDVIVFHAGSRKEDGRVLTNGGRVLGVTGLGKTIKEAADKAYEGVKRIKFEGVHYRKDIGRKILF